MSDDLVERLREHVGAWQLMLDAAEEITRLRAENERVRSLIEDQRSAYNASLQEVRMELDHPSERYLMGAVGALDTVLAALTRKEDDR